MKLQLDPLGCEGVRKQFVQIRHLDNLIGDIDQIDWQVWIEFAHHLAAGSARSTKLAIGQVSSNCNS